MAWRRFATPSWSEPAAGAPPSRRCSVAAGATVQLGCRTPEQAAELAQAAQRALPARCRAARRPCRSRSAAEADLGRGASCSASLFPLRSLAAALEPLRDRPAAARRRARAVQGPDRSRGLTSDDARAGPGRSRPVACLGGPAHAVEAVRAGPRWSPRRTARSPPCWLPSFAKAGLCCDTSTDLVGVRARRRGEERRRSGGRRWRCSAARTPPGRPPAASTASATHSQQARGAGGQPSRAGREPGTSSRRCSPPTAATVVPASCWPRARARGDAGSLGQVSEALELVPLLARAMRERGRALHRHGELAALVKVQGPGRTVVELRGRARAALRAA